MFMLKFIDYVFREKIKAEWLGDRKINKINIMYDCSEPHSDNINIFFLIKNCHGLF